MGAGVCRFDCRPGIVAMEAVGADTCSVDRWGTTPRALAEMRSGVVLCGARPAAPPPLQLPPDEMLHALRAAHAQWAEALGRRWAAFVVRAALRWCEKATAGLQLPGPAQLAVATHTMQFDLWPAQTLSQVKLIGD